MVKRYLYIFGFFTSGEFGPRLRQQNLPRWRLLCQSTGTGETWTVSTSSVLCETKVIFDCFVLLSVWLMFPASVIFFFLFLISAIFAETCNFCQTPVEMSKFLDLLSMIIVRESIKILRLSYVNHYYYYTLINYTAT